MKKVIIAFCVCFILSGCTKKEYNLTTDIQNAIQEACETKLYANNMNKPMYSYYLPAGIGRNLSTGTSNIFNSRGRKFIMNLNISAIIQNKYYQESSANQISSLKNPDIELHGEYFDAKEVSHAYTLEVFQQEESYLTVFMSDTVEFYSIQDPLSTIELSKYMILIARSVQVHEKEVINQYSNKKKVDYVSEKMELFEHLVPESGRVEELFENNKEDNSSSNRNEDGPKQITNSQGASE